MRMLTCGSARILRGRFPDSGCRQFRLPRISVLISRIWTSHANRSRPRPDEERPERGASAARARPPHRSRAAGWRARLYGARHFERGLSILAGDVSDLEGLLEHVLWRSAHAQDLERGAAD